MNHRRRRPPITVVVEEHDGDPIDLGAWARRYVEIVMETEGIRPCVAPPPPVIVGSGRPFALPPDPGATA